jgi:hypothetical protein
MGSSTVGTMKTFIILKIMSELIHLVLGIATVDDDVTGIEERHQLGSILQISLVRNLQDKK